MKNNFWKFIVGIAFFSLIATIIFGSEIPWKNLSTIGFSWPLAKSILYDISVGVLSSMILVLCIDRIQIKMEDIEEAKRRLFLYNKISPLIENYYNFYLFLYIATRKAPVKPGSLVLRSLFLVKDEFIKQLYDTNPFYKNGYMDDRSRTFLQLSLIRKSNNPDEMEKIWNMNTSLPWYKCWNIEAKKFYDGLSQIEKDFPTFFPNELLDNIDKLLNIALIQTNIGDFVEMKLLPQNIIEGLEIPMFPVEFFIVENKIEEALKLLDSIMDYIEKDSSKKLKERSLDFFNNRNAAPKLGDSSGGSDINDKR